MEKGQYQRTHEKSSKGGGHPALCGVSYVGFKGLLLWRVEGGFSFRRKVENVETQVVLLHLVCRTSKQSNQLILAQDGQVNHTQHADVPCQ